MEARAKHHDLAVHRLAVVLYHGDHEPQLRAGGMEHQHHALRAHSPDMRICRSGRHTYQERHRTAIARMVRVRHHLHPQRILAEKSRFQHQRPLLPARSRRCANPHHLVGHTILFLFFGRGKLRCALSDGSRHLLHLRILYRLQMETYLFPFYSLVRYLRHGYFRNPFRYGSAHGRHADDYYHSQELESVARGNIHIYRHFRIFLLYQYRERQPVYPWLSTVF